jgi:hypothetical protein
MISLCPKCSAYYDDGALEFCLADGTPLVPVFPGSHTWNEGTRFIEAKNDALRKRKQKLRLRRLWSLVPALLVVGAGYVLVRSGFIGIERAKSRYKISGQVKNGDTSLNGITITLNGGAKAASITTDTNGYYSSGDLEGGLSYTVTPVSDQQMTFAPVTRLVSKLTQDETADFIALVKATTYKISGRVADEKKPLPGTSLKLEGTTPALTTTNADGNYTFDHLTAGGTYRVTPGPVKDIKFTPSRYSFDKLAQDQSANFTGTSKSDSSSTSDPGCQADEIIVRKIISARLDGSVGASIKNGQSGTLRLPVIDKSGKGLLGTIEQITFFEKCTVASVTIKYSAQMAAVPNKHPLSCNKKEGKWVCP